MIDREKNLKKVDMPWSKSHGKIVEVHKHGFKSFMRFPGSDKEYVVNSKYLITISDDEYLANIHLFNNKEDEQQQ